MGEFSIAAGGRSAITKLHEIDTSKHKKSLDALAILDQMKKT